MRILARSSATINSLWEALHKLSCVRSGSGPLAQPRSLSERVQRDFLSAAELCDVRECSQAGPVGDHAHQQRRQVSAAVQVTAPESDGHPQPGPEVKPDIFARKQRYPQPQNPPSDPWTPTQQLRKRKTLPKRMGFMLEVLEREQVQKQKQHPEFNAGDVLELKLAIPDNQGRVTTFRGICIARRNRGIRTSFTLRNSFSNTGAVERSFPLFSPTIQSIQILESRKVRRAKLYYLRHQNPKESRIA